ncbi:threonine ammonia-lyase [Deinococcus peraridilitoris]|uniref:Threonine dehydratase n=1 Tax=Deinococcus peraridilitoris (strain DSM 19664 / LMG 22246 / CIP 109416 / KR-200) TaxID=937777 RepID=L0A1Y6_DEIPD|nr:threonine/serine dehydratase [Deinococcus peraridilitoris]AFZ67913.1 threonine dehydratase [Deinococcus peraridilitoris DSM 19664]
MTIAESLVTLHDIEQARERLHGLVARSPLVVFPGADLTLKAENLQVTGAFKLRGAFNAILSLSDEERARGVVAHSSGNHAQAVAYAARQLGVHAVIVMPENAPGIKLERTRSYGAEVVIVGKASRERLEKTRELQEARGLTPVPPYDDRNIIAGTGTVALEILEDLPEVQTVLVPVSGGGLLAGVATAIKLSRPEVRVIGVEPELAADTQASFRAGAVVEWDAAQVSRTLADGLRVQRVGTLNWPHIQAYVDDVVTVSEDEIRAAMRRTMLEARLVAEPSGAVTIAAGLFRRGELPQGPTVAILSGGTVEASLLASVLAED